MSAGRGAWGEAVIAIDRGIERAPSGMRRFAMRRDFDVSGVSGTGVVLEGVLFSTGVVVIHWLTPPPRGSISVFDSLDQFLIIHMFPHPENHTALVFEDGEELTAEDVAREYGLPVQELRPNGNGRGD